MSLSSQLSVKELLSTCSDSIKQTSALGEQEGYSGAPTPSNENQRLKTVQGLGKIDWVSSSIFDDFTEFVCQTLDIPMGVVTIIAEDIQWFRSAQGLGDVTETPRSISFCAWALLPQNPEVLIVNDTHKDLRFFNNPVVEGPLNIRSYLGCPMVLSNGHKLGNLCGLANEALQFSRRQIRLLCNLTEVLVRQLEKEQVQKLERSHEHFYLDASNTLLRPMEVFNYGYLLVDVSSDNVDMWSIALATEQAAKLMGVQVCDLKHRFLQDHLTLGPFKEDGVKLSVKEERFSKKLRCTRNDGTQHWIQALFIPAHTDELDNYAVPVNIPEDVEEGIEKQFYFIQLSCTSSQNLQSPLSVKSPLSFPLDDVVSDILSTSTRFSEADIDWSEQSSMTTPRIITGPLLSRTPYETVYRGLFNGETVVIKNIRLQNKNMFDLHKIRYNLTQLQQNEHENIVRLMDWTINEDESELQVVTEYCDVGSLSNAVADRVLQDLGEETVVEFCLQIAEGLQYLHDQVGVAHGRLTSNSVLFCMDIQLVQEVNKCIHKVKIADSGIWLPVNQQEQETSDWLSVNGDVHELHGLDAQFFQRDVEDLGCIISGLVRSCQSELSNKVKSGLQMVVQKCQSKNYVQERSQLVDVIQELTALKQFNNQLF
eukprot:TRINITY_DN33735_c0_g1_i1.p1 TRINITY_DN33735_c0_g1~~TRINITY_DN33735_c0_g1_i1.p1  ORF type:complete len:652 (-),score=64.98 TRINITY_DN33735_c0_g1_i1:946-2901(-)